MPPLWRSLNTARGGLYKVDGAKQLINDEPVLNSLSSELSISLNVSTVQMVLLVNTANSGIKI